MLPSSKPFSSARNTTFNFKKHLDTVHTTVALVPIVPEGKKISKCKRSSVDDGKDLQRQSKRQSTLMTKAPTSQK